MIYHSHFMFQDFMLSIYLRLSWMDRRLAFQDRLNDSMLTLDAKVVDKLWVPDLFFSNEKHGYFHQITVPNRLIRLYKDGLVFYSSR